MHFYKAVTVLLITAHEHPAGSNIQPMRYGDIAIYL